MWSAARLAADRRASAQNHRRSNGARCQRREIRPAETLFICRRFTLRSPPRIATELASFRDAAELRPRFGIDQGSGRIRGRGHDAAGWTDLLLAHPPE